MCYNIITLNYFRDSRVMNIKYLQFVCIINKHTTYISTSIVTYISQCKL